MVEGPGDSPGSELLFGAKGPHGRVVPEGGSGWGQWEVEQDGVRHPFGCGTTRVWSSDRRYKSGSCWRRHGSSSGRYCTSYSRGTGWTSTQGVGSESTPTGGRDPDQ